MHKNKYNTLLLVANWQSDVGYAWWLMESYWTELARNHPGRTILAYPRITDVPAAIKQSTIEVAEIDFTAHGKIADQLRFLRAYHVTTVYLTDQPHCRQRYLYWRGAGVKRIVTHDHTPGLRTPPRGLKRLFKGVRARLPLVTADLSIATTDFVRQRLVTVNCIPLHRTVTAPNGLPALGVEPAQVRAIFGIPQQRLILVSVGRAAPIKNLPFALRCLRRLPDTHLLHIGEGPELEGWARQAEALGVADRVTWAGKRHDVATLLPGCDIAIQPSRGEVGYSLSILEYMRAGLPVIVPDNPSVCGATTDGVDGFIYREDDEDHAVECIRQLAEDPTQRREMGARARQAVKERFTMEKARVELISSVLGGQLIERPRRGPG